MTRITRLSIMKVTRTTRFVLLYYIDIAHTFVQIFIECSRINYMSKSNCKNSMLFVRVIMLFLRVSSCLQFHGYKLHSFYIKHILSRVDSSRRHICIKKW